jgi:transcription elongation factor GreA
MNRIPISVEGYKRLEKELDELKKERPAVIQAIKEAREEGDLRENAGYDAARERQGLLEARISHIESRMIRFEVIDIDTLQSDRAVFGATVTVEDMDSGEQKTFTLLGPDEADHTKGTISIESPWAAPCSASRRATSLGAGPQGPRGLRGRFRHLPGHGRAEVGAGPTTPPSGLRG